MWINDVFIDTIGALTPQGDANALFPFPEGSVIPGKDNVLTVLMDHMGNDEGQNREYGCDLFSRCVADDEYVQKSRIAAFAALNS